MDASCNKQGATASPDDPFTLRTGLRPGDLGAIVAAAAATAQLRWFLVEPGSRGAGLGRRLLREAVALAKVMGYGNVVLWTVSALTAAAHLDGAVGFREVEESAAGGHGAGAWCPGEALTTLPATLPMTGFAPAPGRP